MTTKLELILTDEGFNGHSGHFTRRVQSQLDQSGVDVLRQNKDPEANTITFTVDENGKAGIGKGLLEHLHDDNPLVHDYNHHTPSHEPEPQQPSSPDDVVSQAAYDALVEQHQALKEQKQDEIAGLTEDYLTTLDDLEQRLDTVEDVTGIDPRQNEFKDSLEQRLTSESSDPQKATVNEQTSQQLYDAITILEPTTQELIAYTRGDQSFLTHHLAEHDVDSWDDAKTLSTAYHLQQLRDTTQEQLDNVLSDDDIEQKHQQLQGLKAAYEADPDDERVATLYNDLQTTLHQNKVLRGAQQRLNDLGADQHDIEAIRQSVNTAETRYNAFNDELNGLGDAHITYRVSQDNSTADLIIPGDHTTTLTDAAVTAFADTMPHKAKLPEYEADSHVALPLDDDTYNAHKDVATTAKNRIEQLGVNPVITYEHKTTV